MWDQFIVTPLTNLLLFIYQTIGQNFGIAIVLFTILIRLVTWPLNAQQLKGAQAMQELQNDKEWLAIQKKYEKDKEKLAQEQMRIYKERGINPFGSCLPTLIQFPIIIGLYQAIIRALASTPLQLLTLTRSIYPFLNAAVLIPLRSQFLWMDLSRPEYVAVFGFHLPTLAIIVAVTTYIQSKLTMPPPSPGSDNNQGAMMGNMMSIYMPLLLGYFALTFASGLSVYFITSNLLGILQYAMQGRANWRNLIPGANKKQ
jgi:YidC/Oxa1 family membrane protein insertase